MTTWQRILVAPSVIANKAKVGELILECDRVNAKAIRKGQRPPAVALRRSLARAGADYTKQLDMLAARTAAEATALIRARLAATTVRVPTGVSPHLASLIYCRPLGGIYRGSGAVGIASEDKLNRAINPNTPGYGPYWRAQEYGTGSPADAKTGAPAVPSQLKRRIFGSFFGPGASGAGSHPQSQYTGGGGPHPVFIPGAGGPGTITKEIEPRHFIRDGANVARARWAAQMNRIDRVAAARLTAGAVAGVPPARRRRR